MSLILIGLCTAFNFAVIIRKYRLKRYFDTLVDSLIMAIICVLFSGTFSALVVGMIASMAISIYLYFNPLTFREVIIDLHDEEDEWEDDD